MKIAIDCISFIVSFINSLFCSQPNLVIESGIHPSLYPNCHHQIIYAKFELKIYYPPPYEREVWHYQNADSNAIKKAMTDFFWEGAFENLSVDEKVLIKPSKTYSQTMFLMR